MPLESVEVTSIPTIPRWDMALDLGQGVILRLRRG